MKAIDVYKRQDYLEYEDYDLSSLRIVQVGGSVLESWLAEKIGSMSNNVGDNLNQ